MTKTWKEIQAEKKAKEIELEDKVWDLRVAIGRTKDTQEIERLGKEIEAINKERSELGFINNTHKDPAWLSAYNL
jgi:hypothetical protein